MFYKILAISFSALITICYVVGFIYDASFLEEFGINYYEIIGEPLDYLSIGGMYLLFVYSKHLSVFVIGLAIFGICFVPLKRNIPRDKIEKIVDIESVPYVILSLAPLMFLLLFLVHFDAVDAAKEVRSKNTTFICVESEKECIKGAVLRYRNSKVIFFDSELKATRVFPDRKVLGVKQG